MSKKFNIHDWQAKQRKKLLNETPVGKGDINPAFKINPSKVPGTAAWDKRAGLTVGGDSKKEHHDDKGFPKQSETVNKILDFLKQNYHIKIYDAVEDYLKSINEMNTTGGGASFNAGAGEGYMTPRAFKKKNKED